jgi:alkanesulfonate monooxygenase SsuD/methylene tetrahydromethanopterin reductase-like flavin-dependent oxidoreductase (luciferase family)
VQARDQYYTLPISQQSVYDHIEASYNIGTPEQCWAEMESFADEFKTDEISIITVTHSQADRLDSYRLLAEKL